MILSVGLAVPNDRARTGIYPVDRWGGYTTELAGAGHALLPPLHRRLTAFAVVLIVGHLDLGADVLMAVAILPFVSYSSSTEVARSRRRSGKVVYASLQTLKAHVQEYPGCQRFDVFIRAEESGDVRLHCYTTWDTPWQLEAFLERGYTFERMLARLRRPRAPSGASSWRRSSDGAPSGSRAAPLVGYRDVGQDVRHSRRAISRAWIILGLMVLVYLGWTLTVYFIEPGLR